ncbi:hypothetical protein [Nocardia suismassiliense]|uniref:hypothetical protein n=1 Tax=Nocardia suismassiliense TaxID=2077092 RepID=UPI001F448FDE|nr:hypothetical protein [Nocardia suismassiliense]
MANRPVNRVTTKRRSVDAEAASPEPIDVDESTPAPVSRAKGSGKKPLRRISVPRLDFGRTGSWRRVFAAAAGAVVLGGSAAFAATQPGVDDANAALVDTAATEEVKAAAVHALLTIYGYDVKTIDRYDAAVREVVTGQMLTDLDKFSATTVEAIKQAQTSVQAAADPVGVSMLTTDHAELLVNLTVAATKDGIAQQSVTGTVVLRMKKVNDTWLAGEILDR